MTVGLCMVTYNRAPFAEKAIKAVRKHLTGVVDHIVVVNDGSDPKFNGEYRRVEKATQSIGGTYMALDVNGGVAKAKNVGLRYLLSKDCDWLFTLEDDLIIQSPKAVTEYLRVAEDTGLSHFSYAHHGPANVGPPVDIDGDVEYYFHSIGAWCLFSGHDLMSRGLFDENMTNAFEHVEHELRLGVEPHRFADIVNSAWYVAEIPNSIEKSSIRPRSDWSQNIRNSLTYWRDEKPETFKLMFGDGTPLQAYAQSIIA